MAWEIERKFLVQPGWLPQCPGTGYVQGYLHRDPEGPSVRVRMSGDRAFLAIKGPPQGPQRQEFEYPIPPDDARELLASFAGDRVIEKTRHVIRHEGHTWEIDVFQGRNSGLVLAEVELERADEQVALPGWAGREVTDDRRYANAFLAAHPWSQWGQKEGSR